MMRIITGTARGTKLTAPEGETTRPTSERAKEGLFNVLQGEMEGRRVLDLFAGSGQLALEALSRGAAFAVLADKDEGAFAALKQNVTKTHMEAKSSLLFSDYQTAIRSLSQKGERFDLLFLDPPYGAGLMRDALTRLLRGGLIADNALIVCEHEGETPDVAGLCEIRLLRYGRNHFSILKKEETV